MPSVAVCLLLASMTLLIIVAAIALARGRPVKPLLRDVALGFLANVAATSVVMIAKFGQSAHSDSHSALHPALDAHDGGARAKKKATVAESSEPGLVDFRGERLTAAEAAAAKAVADKTLPAGALPVNAADLRERLPYRPGVYRDRRARHFGQRKLLLSEVDFLADYARDGDTVVYAGAAPGIHVPFLAWLFRGAALRFVLYDPRKFVLPRLYPEVLSRIETHRAYFTDDVARQYAGRDDVLFVSDIRTEIDEAGVGGDMEAQRQWVRLMNPRAAMLKYRPPYASDAPASYLAGEIRLQAWAPRASTEGRLISVRPHASVERDPRDYEEKLYYLNVILRQWARYAHDVPLELVAGLDRSFDAALEAHIWAKYLAYLAQATPETPDTPDRGRAIAQLFNEASRSLPKGLDAGPSSPPTNEIDPR